jgi:hypothetical protein
MKLACDGGSMSRIAPPATGTDVFSGTDFSLGDFAVAD